MKHQVLDDVDRVMGHRELVQRRQVPRREHDVEDHEAPRRRGDPARERADAAQRKQRPQHPARRPHDQQRRDDQREHQVLHHVRAEQVVVAQVVQPAVEREEDQGERGVEARALGAARAGGVVCSGATAIPASYSAPSPTIPITVLGCTVKLVRRCAPRCGAERATAPSVRAGELPEQEEQGDERGHRDDQRSGEQRPEQLVVVLEVHVEQHDDRELHRRHDEQHRHEERRFR